MAAISAMPHRAFDLSYPGPASALAGARDRGSTLVRQDRARLSKPTPSQRVSAGGRGSVAVRSSIDDIPDEIPEELIPDALKGLVLNEDGDLVDTKTGKVLNEFGATCFDVAVRAIWPVRSHRRQHRARGGSDHGHPHAISHGLHLPGQREEGGSRPGLRVERPPRAIRPRARLRDIEGRRWRSRSAEAAGSSCRCG